jgi:tetratricopeptide (TPR) repeat protein
MRHFKHILIYVFSFLLLSSCKKLLQVKPDDSLSVPSTLDDCQALLDDDRVMNGFGNSGYPSMPQISCDDYYVTDEQYGSFTLVNQQAVTWNKQITTGDEFPDWDLPYRTVFTANNVLAILEKIPSFHEQPRWNRIKGAALYFRAFAFFELAQVFAPVYDNNTAVTDWGIPLRLSADVNEKISRATMQDTYDRILGDLREARSLLPKGLSNWPPTRPSLAAVYALLARVYLSTRNYPLALRYADSCLRLKGELINYDTVSTTSTLPFNRWNPEVIFSAAYFRSGPAALYRSHVDSGVLQSYGANDLRKRLFFKFGDYFFGTYDQEGYCFAGLAVDEMYLIRSECFARAGNTPAAMDDLNHLLQTRWAAGTFIPYVATDANDALLQILQERRKELLFRGTRWTDLRRLNKDNLTARSLTRTINGHEYKLPPGDPRWVLPIPDYVLSFNPEMPQNVR